MGKAFLFIVPIGLGIGLMLPSGEESTRTAPAVAAAAASPTDPSEDSEEPVETRLQREEDGHFYVHAKVNGELVRFLVDTGATSVALTIPTAERLGIPVSRSEFEVVGRGASGPVRGQHITLDSVSVDGKRVTDVSGAVLEGLDVSLLGQTYLSQIGGVEMSGDTMTLN